MLKRMVIVWPRSTALRLTVGVGSHQVCQDVPSKPDSNPRLSKAGTMALEGNLLVGRLARGSGLCVTGCSLHRTRDTRVARDRHRGYGSCSPAARLELDRFAKPPLLLYAVHPRLRQLHY